MKRAITVFGIILFLGLISWAIPNQHQGGIQKEAAGIETSSGQIRQNNSTPQEDAGFGENARKGIGRFLGYSGFANATLKHGLMILAGLLFLFLAIRHNFEPLLLVPIGMGILIGNIPFMLNAGLDIGIYEKGSVLNYLYFGVTAGVYPPLIFLGLGAMTDFSYLISNPKTLLLGAAAQVGIFVTLLAALYLGFTPPEAAAIGIIGGADGPTAIFTASKLANGFKMWNGVQSANLIGPIAIAAYSYMALVPVIQPPIMRLLTTKKERRIRMKSPRQVSRVEKILFPVIGLLLTCFISPSALPLLGMLFFGNILRESGVTRRLADTAKTSLIDITTILIGLTVGASTQADVFLTSKSLMIFALGAISFAVATAGGVSFAKLMNLFLKPENRVNPLIGSAGVSAVPAAARVSQVEGLRADPTNHLLMHAMGPNVAGVIGSAVAAGIMLSFLL
ncbi:MAG: sodium ion-translocating decarboxylase subunit beta [Bacteroidales bacterium]|jgi:oxaloacetate decarboxylase beta subunit